MPEPITAAIAWIGAEIGGTIGATLIMNAEAIAIGATIVSSVAASSAQQSRARAKAMAAYRASLKDRELTLRSAIAPRRYVYGRDRLSGPLVYAETTGDKKQFLHLVIALAAHECDAIEEVWFGDELLPEPDAAGLIQSGQFFKGTIRADQAYLPPTSGAVTLPRAASRVVGITYSQHDSGQIVATGWSHTPGTATITGLPDVGMVTVEYEWFDGQPRVRIKKHLGQPGQVADADLVAESDGKWTAAHKGTGICYLYTRLEWDQDVFGSTGVPEIKCVIRGRKLADPRTSTVVWSDNAALAVADWLQRGEGLRASSAQVPSAEVIDAANVADELVPLNVAGDTQRRYTVNTSFTADQSPRQVLATLLQPMAGTAVWVQGRWLLRPGAYRTPAAPITANILAGSGVSIQPKASRADLYNAVRATYRDPAQGWAEVQAPMVTNAMYEAEDGGVRRVRDIQLDSAMDALRAQRLAKIELERGRQAMTVQLSTNLAGYNLAPTDVVPLQLARYGWPAGKDFEVIERTYTADGNIGYLLRETAAGVWAWAYGEATTVDLAPDTSLPNPYGRPPALTGLTVASGTPHLLRQIDGTLLTRAYVTWDASGSAFVRQGGRIELRWRAAGTEQWQAEPPLPGDATSAYVAPVPDGTAVTFSVRQVNAVGSASDWAAVMVTILGKTEPPSNVTGFSSSVASGVIRWTWNTPPDIDYQVTEVRATDANWSSDVNPPLWRGRASEWPETVVAAGTYTRYARHIDTGGRTSAATATRTQVVSSADLTSRGLVINASALVFQYPAAGGVNPSAITLEAVKLGALPGMVSWVVSSGTATLSASTGDTVTLAAASMATDQATIIASVDDGGTTYTATVSLSKVRDGVASLSLVLSPQVIVLPSDAAGNVTSFASATCTATVLSGVTDETGSWALSRSNSAGVSSTLAGNVLTITAFDAAYTTGYVDITATRSGYGAISRRLTLAKTAIGGGGGGGGGSTLDTYTYTHGGL